MPSQALARQHKNKTPTESAEITQAQVAKVKKSAAKKVEAAEAEATEATAAARGQGFAQAGLNIAADTGMEVLFTMSKTAAKYEGWAAGAVTVGAGLGAAFTEGYSSSVFLGIATASGGRLARMGVRAALS